MKRLLIFCCWIFSFKALKGQCIDTISFSSDYTWTEVVDYMSYCPLYVFSTRPVYVFSYREDTSKQFNMIGSEIDFNLAPLNVKSLKYKVDKVIKDYSGADFFSKVIFEDAYVAYHDSLQKLIDDKLIDDKNQVEIKNCKARFIYFYSYKPDSISSFRFGVALDNEERTIKKFLFPSKKEYKPIDKTFNYCKLISIAKKLKKDIEPIEEIEFEYSIRTKKFYWRITEKDKNPKLGASISYAVLIDASNISKSRLIKSETFTVE